MAAEIKNENGLIRISNAVIAKIAGYAATKCYGVVGMAMRTGKDGLARLLKKENLDKGIKIKVEDDKVDITLFVINKKQCKVSGGRGNGVKGILCNRKC